jgi:hypothetical protein
MKVGRLPGVLAGVFLIGLAGSATSATTCLAAGTIRSEELTEILVQLLSVYSVHLAVVIAGMFAHDSKIPDAPLGSGPALVAIVLAVLWNTLLFGRFLMFAVVKADAVDELLSYTTRVSAASSFLVAGTLSYVFSREGKQAG